MPVFTGTAGKDTLTGTAGDDTLQGLDGDDFLRDSQSGSDLMQGGAGNDDLFVGHLAVSSSATMDGGAGDDMITAIGVDGTPTTVGGQGPTGLMTVSITGGDGADMISVSGRSTGTIDGGAGDDSIAVDDSSNLGFTITLGAGADTVNIAIASSAYDAPHHDTITDFHPGAGGDVIDARSLGFIGWDGGNPFTEGYLHLTQGPTGAVLQVDPSGGGHFVDAVIFTGTQASQFTAANFESADSHGYDPAPSSPPGNPTVPGDPAPPASTNTVLTSPTIVAAGQTLSAPPGEAYSLDIPTSSTGAVLTIAGTLANDTPTFEDNAFGVKVIVGDQTQTVYIASTGVLHAGATGEISQAFGYYVQTFDGESFENHGLVQVSDTGSNTINMAFGVRSYANIGTYLNYGTIEVSAPHGFAAGLDLENLQTLEGFTNGGVISVTEGTYGFGVSFGDVSHVSFLNLASGSITVSGPQSVGVSIDAFGSVPTDGITYVNAGLIQADTALGFRQEAAAFGNDAHRMFDNQASGVLRGAVSFVGNNVTLHNAGLIDGAVSITGNGATLSNAGLVNGAVNMGVANEVYDGSSGGSVNGLVSGGQGDDVLIGGAHADSFQGNQGNDTENGGGGDDIVVGGKDNDSQTGDDGNDVVWGNLGNDTLDGGAGNDQVRGGQGDDSISGGAGNDFISGDRGNDTESGGAGADLFHGSQDAGIDKVLDFNRAEGDRVELDPGTTYTLSQVGADTVIDMGASEGAPNQMILVGVQLSSLKDGWIFEG